MISYKDIIINIPEGYMVVSYNNRRYAMTKQIFNKGRSIKIYAKELAGRDFISLNYYITKKGFFMKPCEMEDKKVINFLFNMKFN